MKDKIKALIKKACKIEMGIDEIKDDALLFGQDSDLGLDSIDAIEVLIAIEKEFNIHLDIDKEDALTMFNSVGAIAKYLEKNHGCRS
uniref:Carrier domain-containing protein n=1 Tax=viral metagenome TaxID=1070528 RepID=A0A6M3INE5_9ZZZZ